MAVHYYPGIGVVRYHFWPVKILTPHGLDLAAERGSWFMKRVDRQLSRLGLIRHVTLLDRDV